MKTSSKKTVLITGASKGIGYETALAFAKNKELNVKSILLASRKSPHFDEVVDQLKNSYPSKDIVKYEIDVEDRLEVINLCKKINQSGYNVDVLINNAGYTNPNPLHQIDFADFEKTMSVNLYAPFTFVQELLHQGNLFTHIVNIASTAGINGRSGWLTYSTSKAAVINMTQVMREELSVYGTRVICLSPGRTATDLRKTLAPDENPATIMQPSSVAEVIIAFVSPLGRVIDSENIVVRL